MRHPLSTLAASMSGMGVGDGAALGGPTRKRKTQNLDYLAACGIWPAPGATLDIDFVNNRGYSLGRGITTAEDLIEFTRSGGQAYYDYLGSLQTAATNRIAFDHDPITLAATGASFWEQRTNSLRNNKALNAAAGTPGTNPTYVTIASTIDGLTKSITNVGTTNGVNTFDVRWAGTTTASNSPYLIYLEGNTQINAANGDIWTGSVIVSLAAGSLSNLTDVYFLIRFNNSAGVPIAIRTINIKPLLTGNLLRIPITFAATDANTAKVNILFGATYNSGSAVDFTLRIGMSQLELGSSASPVIATSGAAATRAASAAKMTGKNFSRWYNQNEGTFVAKYLLPGAANAGLNSGVVEVNAGMDFNNSMSVYASPALNVARNSRRSGATQFGFVAYGAAALNVVQTVSLSYKTDDFASSCNGLAPETDLLGIPPTVDTLSIANIANGQILNGSFLRLIYFPQKSNAGPVQRLSTL